MTGGVVRGASSVWVLVRETTSFGGVETSAETPLSDRTGPSRTSLSPRALISAGIDSGRGVRALAETSATVVATIASTTTSEPAKTPPWKHQLLQEPLPPYEYHLWQKLPWCQQ